MPGEGSGVVGGIGEGIGGYLVAFNQHQLPGGFVARPVGVTRTQHPKLVAVGYEAGGAVAHSKAAHDGICSDAYFQHFVGVAIGHKNAVVVVDDGVGEGTDRDLGGATATPDIDYAHLPVAGETHPFGKVGLASVARHRDLGREGEVAEGAGGREVLEVNKFHLVRIVHHNHPNAPEAGHTLGYIAQGAIIGVAEHLLLHRATAGVKEADGAGAVLEGPLIHHKNTTAIGGCRGFDGCVLGTGAEEHKAAQEEQGVDGFGHDFLWI